MRGTLLGALVGGQTVKYARTGEVVAPDWNPDPECGGGLHGLVRGCGNVNALSHYPGAIWIVFAARESEVVEFDGKAKAPRGRVVYYGERQRAIDLLCEEYPDAPIVYRTATVGHRGTATVGDRGTASAGKNGCIQLKYWDGERTRIVTGYIGENGLEPNVTYKLDENHQFVKA
jgi:hypothetical protein